MQLQHLLMDEAAPIAGISDWLNSLSQLRREAEVLSLNRTAQRRLFNKASEARPVKVSDFVPEGYASLAPVRHAGKNTLPLPPSWKHFEKCFCRPDDQSHRLFGYNVWDAFLGQVGPGYFVAYDTLRQHEWSRRGAVVVDYFQVPDGDVPTEWPRVVPNTQGLQKFVFNKTRDYMRYVSRGVTVGAAYRKDKSLDHYFVLVRQE